MLFPKKYCVVWGVLLAVWTSFLASEQPQSQAIKNIVFDLTGVVFMYDAQHKRVINLQMHRLIKKLKQQGYGLYVLSNIPRSEYQRLSAQYALFNRFSGIMLAFQEGVKKPNQQIYHLFFKKFDLAPATCLFIDDEEPNVLAARAVGMKSVLFTSYNGLMQHLKNEKLL